MSSSDCSSGEFTFSITYTSLSIICALIITYFAVRLIHWHISQRTKPGRSSDSWSFWSSIVFIILSIGILIKCAIHSLSNCNAVSVESSTHNLIFDVIFSDLYVIQLYILWIVLLIRLHSALSATPYHLSRLCIRIYAALILMFPLFTALLCVPSLYTIFLVLSLSAGIFMTLSIVLLYLLKLIQVFSSSVITASVDPEHHDKDHIESDSLKSHQIGPDHDRHRNHNQNHRAILTRLSVLSLTSCCCSLSVLFVLILDFVFAVYSVQYLHQRRFLEAVHLLDVMVTAVCIVMMQSDGDIDADPFVATTYHRLCGCMDRVCRFWCSQLADPTVSGGSAHLLPVDAMRKLKVQPVSVTLQRPTSDLDHLHRHIENGNLSEMERMVRSDRNDRKNVDHRYWSDYKDVDLDHRSLPPLKLKGDSERIHDELERSGFDPKYIKRAMAVYEVFSVDVP